MPALVKLANVKGPKGDDIVNPRLSGDSLLIDTVNRSTGTPVTTTRNIGSIRGRKGDSFTNARVTGGDLLVDVTSTSGTYTANLGTVQGPQGLPGTNAVENDAAVAAYIATAGTSATKDALDGYFSPTLSREQRAALADRIAAWIGTTARNRRGDEVMQGTLRRMRIKKSSASSPTLTEISAEDEDPQATATGLALQFMAKYATVYPEKAQQVRPTVDRLVATLEAMQSYDDTKPHYGGFLSSGGFAYYGALAAGQAVRGLIAAYQRYGVGQWLEMAKLGGAFLRTLSNPNVTYMTLYGVNVIDVPAGTYVMCERISDAGKLDCAANAWNLVGVQAMYELGAVTGDSSWVSDAEPIRDFMATTLTGFYDYFATKAHAAGVAAGRVDPTPVVNASTPIGNDNAWHRMGEGTGKGTLESDAMEYALSALYHMGYNVATLRTAYEALVAMPQGVIPSTATPAFKAAYNSTNRYVSWAGYFRINDPEAGGASESWGGYLDVQGAGELLEWKHDQYPTHYELTLPAIRAIVEPDRGALLIEDLTTLWTADPLGGVYAVQGTIPIAVAGIGLLATNPTYDLEVTA